MNKVGIMSMQRIANYGSFLQAYALKEILQEREVNIEFVDYHIEPVVISQVQNEKRGISGKVYKALETMRYDAPLLHKFEFLKYKEAFSRSYLPILGISKDMNYTPELDCLLIGSDEVFNCIQKNANVGCSMELFGKDNRAKKLISYAASFGNTTLEKLVFYRKADEVGRLLKTFDCISVRDKNSGIIVEQLTGKMPEYHFDPVLIYDFINKCNRIPIWKSTEKYLILYAYSGRISNNEAIWITDYAKKRGLKIYAIGGIQKCADRFINCTPFEIFTYFINAEEIITDTFHGSIFSIITHKKFTTIVRESIDDSYGNEEKLIDLLTRLNLMDRLTKSIQYVNKINEKEVNYDLVDKIIYEQRQKTNEYFKREIG
ncbi:hypothetical protein BLA28_15455 [Eisenbergiella tayi]|uniref:Polysaccharide pyruvyl transferase n=1 Tax=Eisenbergiella tayi TaxID=1432052 RepID=A0A1E3ALF9_9FIRM|nr:polysaccharide pyruvyl transferase family protein [Eisenbergiella tayi]ODM09567.1 Polysaccharide pyruvyl transferase [Eisenbergiella tayi]OIZ63325.1 hypothetical protein BLA28_15455 [Eisenbergiella tayi]